MIIYIRASADFLLFKHALHQGFGLVLFDALTSRTDAIHLGRSTPVLIER